MKPAHVVENVTMNIEGGCLCSSIRYHLTELPLFSIICHCQTCRKASAAPSVGWVTFNRTSFEFVSGNPSVYQSSAGVFRTFCSFCGTPLTYANDQTPDILDITTGSLDEPHRFPPDREVWLEHKLGWEATNDSLDQYSKDSNDTDS